ncbi:MAG TPA: hypothetical protein VFF03_02080 [Rhodocyclaceae bacterium]|nr:hypothetical protein [Rhodocyclaceae bacterium]
MKRFIIRPELPSKGKDSMNASAPLRNAAAMGIAAPTIANGDINYDKGNLSGMGTRHGEGAGDVAHFRTYLPKLKV